MPQKPGEKITINWSGYRSNSNGSLGNGGSNGYYWSSSPSGTTNAYGLNFNSGNLNAHNNNNNNNPQRAYGKPVRPVQELEACMLEIIYGKGNRG